MEYLQQNWRSFFTQEALTQGAKYVAYAGGAGLATAFAGKMLEATKLPVVSSVGKGMFWCAEQTLKAVLVPPVATFLGVKWAILKGLPRAIEWTGEKSVQALTKIGEAADWTATHVLVPPLRFIGKYTVKTIELLIDNFVVKPLEWAEKHIVTQYVIPAFISMFFFFKWCAAHILFPGVHYGFECMRRFTDFVWNLTSYAYDIGAVGMGRIRGLFSGRIRRAVLLVFGSLFEYGIIPLYGYLERVIDLALDGLVLLGRGFKALVKGGIRPALHFLWDKILKPFFRTVGKITVEAAKLTYRFVVATGRVTVKTAEFLVDKIIVPVLRTVGKITVVVWETCVKIAEFIGNVVYNILVATGRVTVKIAEFIGNVVYNILKTVGKSVVWVIDNVIVRAIKLLVDILERIGKLIYKVVVAIADFITWAVTLFVNKVLTPIATAVWNLAQWFWNSIIFPVLNAIWTAVVAIGNALYSVGAAVGNVIVKVISAIVDALAAVATAVGNAVYSLVTNVVYPVAASIAGIAAAIANSVGAIVTQLAVSIGNAIAAVFKIFTG